MAKYTNDELLEAFGEMTLVELSEFVKAFEEKFDVEAAAPAAVAVAAPGAAAPAEEEKDEFDVILSAVGDKKIQVIKAVRAITSLGLAEAKALVDGAPKAVLEKAKKEDADEGQVPARRSRRHRRAQVIRAASSRNHQACNGNPVCRKGCGVFRIWSMTQACSKMGELGESCQFIGSESLLSR